jgi:hypothetical protein
VCLPKARLPLRMLQHSRSLYLHVHADHILTDRLITSLRWWRDFRQAVRKWSPRKKQVRTPASIVFILMGLCPRALPPQKQTSILGLNSSI